jgi:hypothetical protein
MIKSAFGSAKRETFNPQFFLDGVCLVGGLKDSEFAVGSKPSLPANAPAILISAAPVGESSQAVDAAAISRI